MMNGIKRSYVVPKTSGVRFNGKLKDIISSRHKSEGKKIEPDLANVPILKQSDNARLLPKYTTILAKSDDGISMDDLDQLQHDLEKLLSSSSIRIRYLLSEIGAIDTSDRKAHDKTSLKRKRPDEKPKFKDLKNGIRIAKKQYGLAANTFNSDGQQEMPKVTLPKNDNSDKFWASIEPFCTNVNKDDISFLGGLIKECSKEIDIKIPEPGEHYARAWSEEMLNEEQNLAKSFVKNTGNPDRRNGFHTMMDTFSTPQTQRLLAALIEERVLNGAPKNGENGTRVAKLKSSDFTKIKSSMASQKVGACLERRLKKELVEQGILNREELTQNVPEDEIAIEIRKCQQELAMVNEYNIEELSKLKTVACIEMHSNELQGQLEKVDKQVLDMYNKIVISRKTSQQEEGNEFDKVVFTEQITKEFETQVDALLKRQANLNREINGLTDMHMIY